MNEREERISNKFCVPSLVFFESNCSKMLIKNYFLVAGLLLFQCRNLFKIYFPYFFGCVGSQLQHMGSQLWHVGSLLRHAGFSLVAACGFSLSSCGTWARARGLCSCGTQAQLPRSMWDLSSPTRDRIRVPCIGRQILYHWTTWEVPLVVLKNA